MAITSDQLRSARALLKMEQKALAEATSVPVQTLKRYEGGTGFISGNGEYIAALESFLIEKGVTFLSPGDVTDGGYGVRLTRKPFNMRLKRMTAEEQIEYERQQDADAEEAREGHEAHLKTTGQYREDE